MRGAPSSHSDSSNSGGTAKALREAGLPEAVLGVILADDEYADEQLSRIAQEMGFNDELVAVLDKLGR